MALYYVDLLNRGESPVRLGFIFRGMRFFARVVVVRRGVTKDSLTETYHFDIPDSYAGDAFTIYIDGVSLDLNPVDLDAEIVLEEEFSKMNYLDVQRDLEACGYEKKNGYSPENYPELALFMKG
jgi:hypothetical protein